MSDWVTDRSCISQWRSFSLESGPNLYDFFKSHSHQSVVLVYSNKNDSWLFICLCLYFLKICLHSNFFMMDDIVQT